MTERKAKGGWRPGAGRPRTSLKVKLQAAEVAELESWAYRLGVEPEQVAAVMVRLALRNEKTYIDARDFR